MAGQRRPFGRNARQLDRSVDQRAEEVRFVIVVHALQHGRDALQPHARIDGRLRQAEPLRLRNLLVLHEHEVPDLDEPVAILIRAAGGPPGIFGPWSKNISEHGPQGPVSPIDQKLSEVEMRIMRSSGSPAILRHSEKASSSSEKTVTKGASCRARILL